MKMTNRNFGKISCIKPLPSMDYIFSDKKVVHRKAKLFMNMLKIFLPQTKTILSNQRTSKTLECLQE